MEFRIVPRCSVDILDTMMTTCEKQMPENVCIKHLNLKLPPSNEKKKNHPEAKVVDLVLNCSSILVLVVSGIMGLPRVVQRKFSVQ